MSKNLKDHSRPWMPNRDTEVIDGVQRLSESNAFHPVSLVDMIEREKPGDEPFNF